MQINQAHNQGTNSWKYYNDLEGFCIYFYKRLRKLDPKAYNVKTNEEVLEFYQSSPSHLEFITTQWNARRTITNKEQARKSTLVFEREIGIWAMSPETKKEAESLGGINAIKKRKKDPIKWAESLKPSQIAGGKKQGPIQGRKNVESGHWAKINKLGRDASAKARKELTKKRRKEILPYISDQWITHKSVGDWFMQSKYLEEFGLESSAFVDDLLSDEKYFKYSGNGKNKRYVKTSSKYANQPGDPISRLEYIISENFKDTTFELKDLEKYYSNFKDISDPKQWIRNKLKDTSKYKNLGQLGTGRGGGPFTYCLVGANIKSSVLSKQDMSNVIKNNISDVFVLRELRDLCAKLNFKESFVHWFKSNPKHCIKIYDGKFGSNTDLAKYKIIAK